MRRYLGRLESRDDLLGRIDERVCEFRSFQPQGHAGERRAEDGGLLVADASVTGETARLEEMCASRVRIAPDFRCARDELMHHLIGAGRRLGDRLGDKGCFVAIKIPFVPVFLDGKPVDSRIRFGECIVGVNRVPCRLADIEAQTPVAPGCTVGLPVGGCFRCHAP